MDFYRVVWPYVGHRIVKAFGMSQGTLRGYEMILGALKMILT